MSEHGSDESEFAAAGEKFVKPVGNNKTLRGVEPPDAEEASLDEVVPGQLTQYSLHGAGYAATTSTIKSLPAGCYDIVQDNTATFVIPSQKSNGILLQSEACPQESKQELCINPNQHRSFRKLRRWSLQNLSCFLFQPKRWIRQIRWYVWFLSIFLSWNVAIPKTIAETSLPAMETATTLLSRSIRPLLPVRSA